VIIGRLIPAGTGFNSYNSHANIYRGNSQQIKASNFNQVLSQGVDTNFEDIILDDREARNLTHLRQNIKNIRQISFKIQ